MSLAARRDQFYDSAAMANSLIRRAYQATSFRSISKGLTAIGLSALTIVWNWIFGVRNWDTTKTFLLCVPLAYASVALLALAWNLTILGAKDLWAAFIGSLRTDLIGAVKEAAREAVPVEPKAPRLRSTGGRTDAHTVIKIMEFLHDKPKGQVSLVSEAGDPEAYQDLLRISEAFRASGWTVTTGMANLGGPGVFLMINNSTPEQTVALVSEALVASGLSFHQNNTNDAEQFTTCTIYISNRQQFL